MPLCSIWNTCVLETNMIGANRKETGANLFPLSIKLNKKIVFRNLKSIFIIHYILFIIFSFLQNARATAAPRWSSPPRCLLRSIEKIQWKLWMIAGVPTWSTPARPPHSPQHLHGMDTWIFLIVHILILSWVNIFPYFGVLHKSQIRMEGGVSSPPYLPPSLYGQCFVTSFKECIWTWILIFTNAYGQAGMGDTDMDIHKKRHKDTGHKDTGTQRHSRETKTQQNTKTHQGHKDTGTQRHRDTKTQGHKDTGTQRHGDTKTQGHKDTGKYWERRDLRQILIRRRIGSF